MMDHKPLISIDIESTAVADMLDRVEQATGPGGLAPLMVAIRQELVAQAEANFAAQGRPSWPALAQVTQDLRKAKRKWPGQILQVSGTLARSLVAQSDDTMAMVGVGREVPYSAIHQLGGMAGRNRKVKIPARPYLPMLNGQLQPQAEQAIVQLGHEHLHKAVEGGK